MVFWIIFVVINALAAAFAGFCGYIFILIQNFVDGVLLDFMVNNKIIIIAVFALIALAAAVISAIACQDWWEDSVIKSI